MMAHEILNECVFDKTIPECRGSVSINVAEEAIKRAIKLVEEKLKPTNTERDVICEWKYDGNKNNTHGYYHTEWGNMFRAFSSLDKFNYCLYCGRKLTPVS